MYFRKITFMVEGHELCSTTGMLPVEGREIRIELLAGTERYIVARIVELYGSGDAYPDMVMQAIGGGVFRVTPDLAEVHLTPID